MNKKTIENLLQETDFSKENPDFRDALKTRLSYKMETTTLFLQRPKNQRKWWFRPTMSTASVLMVCFLTFTFSTYGNEILTGIKNIFRFSDNITVFEQKSSSQEYFNNYYTVVNALLKGKLFDENGIAADYFVKDTFGNFQHNSASLYRQDGQKVYSIITKENENRIIKEVTPVTQKEYTDIFGTTQIDTYTTLEDAKAAVGWDFRAPTALPEGYVFKRIEKQVTTMASETVYTVLTLYYDDQALNNSPIRLELYNKSMPTPEQRIFVDSSSEYTLLNYNGISVMCYGNTYYWDENKISYALTLADNSQFESILDSFK